MPGDAARADIRSGEVLDRLRPALIRFCEQSRQALQGALGAVERRRQWLELEELPTQRRRLLRAEQHLAETRIAWRYAEDAKPSSIDEEMAFRRARQEHERAGERLAACQAWLRRLDRHRRELLAPIRTQLADLERLGPAALARLDAMRDGLDRYHGPTEAP